MRLALLTALTMVAFAANSILNRLALADGAAGPADFAALRLVSGAVMLCMLVALRDPARLRGSASLRGAASLATYMLGFSFAYISLDAGVGALILFGGVQITMFAGALIGGERPHALRWAGAAIALGGLAWLVWPTGAVRPDPAGVVLMAAAALGWGVYSLIGRASRDPLAATAANFLWAAPAALAVWLIWDDGSGMTGWGALLAVLSGAVTSGLGYALWYSVLPALAASSAALAQLTVPVIAALGGAVLLGEALTARGAVAGALVLGGVALGTLAGRRRQGAALRREPGGTAGWRR